MSKLFVFNPLHHLQGRQGQQFNTATSCACSEPQVVLGDSAGSKLIERPPVNLRPMARRAVRPYQVIVSKVIRLFGIKKPHSIDRVCLKAVNLPAGYYFSTEGNCIILRKKGVNAFQPRRKFWLVHLSPFFKRVFAQGATVQPAPSPQHTPPISWLNDCPICEQGAAKVEQVAAQNSRINDHLGAPVRMVRAADLARPTTGAANSEGI